MLVYSRVYIVESRVMVESRVSSMEPRLKWNLV